MSVYYAFSGIDDAIEKTKNLLWPFNWGIWLRIAVISLFTGSLSGINFPFSSPTTGSASSNTSQFDIGFTEFPEIIIWLIILFILIAVIYTFISSVFQFVFVKCLSENEFRLKQYFSENIGRGIRLFGFWIILGLVIFAALAVFLLSVFTSASNPLLIIPVIGLFLLVILLTCIIALFTTDFVVPIMLKDDCGVLEGWKRCWKILRVSPSQSIIYLVMKVIISIVAAILLVIAAIIVILAIGIPFLVLALLLEIGVGLSLLNIVLLILFLIIVIPVMLMLFVPFNTFLRIYSLSVLGKMDPEYKLIE